MIRLFIVLLFLSFNVGAVEVLVVDPECKEITWTAPTMREDGAPLLPAEIAGYVIYYGKESGVYDSSRRTAVLNMSCSDLGLPSGISHIAGLTIDTNGLTSQLSSEITRNISAKPNAPVFGAN